jgi:predicted O-methyltransferase YrrM
MSINTLLVRILKRQSAPAPAAAVEEVLAPLAEPFRGALLSMYREEPMLGVDGERHPIDKQTRINPAQGMWFYELCCSMKPRATLEVGFAYGFSTLFFLAAIAVNKAGHHTAVDPFERSDWHGIGLANVRVTGSESSFRHIEDRSDRAATDLARQNSSFDIIYIDGNHRFDDTLVEFYLYAALCRIDGLIIFDDMWMSSIQTVVSFVRSNLPDFAEVATPLPNVRAFRRVGQDVRRWDHFKTFSVAGNGPLGR